MRAVAEGVLDLRSADPREPHFWTRLRWLLAAYEDRLTAESLKETCALARAVLSRSDLAAESRKRTTEHLESAYTQLRKLRTPWLESTLAAAARSATDGLAEAWAAAFGDPDDPEVQARIAADVERLEREHAANLTAAAARQAPPGARRRRRRQGGRRG